MQLQPRCTRFDQKFKAYYLSAAPQSHLDREMIHRMVRKRLDIQHPRLFTLRVGKIAHAMMIQVLLATSLD